MTETDDFEMRAYVRSLQTLNLLNKVRGSALEGSVIGTPETDTEPLIGVIGPVFGRFDVETGKVEPTTPEAVAQQLSKFVKKLTEAGVTGLVYVGDAPVNIPAESIPTSVTVPVFVGVRTPLSPQPSGE